MTIHLRPAAAASLNSTWLYQRMHVNPRLFVSRVRERDRPAGLDAFEHQAKQPLPATAGGRWINTR